MSLDMIAVDPLAGVKLAPVKTRGYHAWELEECARFEAHHAIGTRARLAYELLLQVGHARCDVVRMGRQHIRNGTLSLERQKTKVPFHVPVMPKLQEAIDAMPPSMTFLVTRYGKPFTAANSEIGFARFAMRRDYQSDARRTDCERLPPRDWLSAELLLISS